MQPRKLVVTNKTGFEISDVNQAVIIRDNRQILFYSTEPTKPKIKQFNLPGFGTYWVESGSFQQLSSPVKYPYADLPPVILRTDPLTGKDLPDPSYFELEWGYNEAKATIKWNLQKILISNKFENKPLNEIFFVLYHEYAHRYKVPDNVAQHFADNLGMSLYSYQESIADQISGNYMKATGFNPEQIGSAPITALSARQYQRKVNMVDSVLKSQKK